MSVLLIADVHANVAALDALPLAEHVLCAGDLVGYGTQPREAIARVHQRRIVCVRGDEDDAVGNGVAHIAPTGFEQGCSEMRAWTHRQLSPIDRAFLAHLAPEYETVIDGVRIAVTHAYPGDYERYIKPTDEQLDRIANAYPHANLIVLGHTHRPGVWRLRSTLIVNPGSLGLPFRSGQGSYAELKDGRIRFGVVRFDVAEQIQRIRGLPISGLAKRQCERALMEGAARPFDRVSREVHEDAGTRRRPRMGAAT